MVIILSLLFFLNYKVLNFFSDFIGLEILCFLSDKQSIHNSKKDVWELIKRENEIKIVENFLNNNIR